MLLRLPGAEPWVLLPGLPPEEDIVILEGNKIVPDPLVLVMHGSWQPAVTFLSVPRHGVTVLQRTEQELPLVRRRKNRNGFRPGGTF